MSEEYDDEFSCWHRNPFGPGPYCTGCGGKIVDKKVVKKYTIIYGVPSSWYPTSRRGFVAKFDHVETDNLMETLEQDKYDGNIWFVFDGWCEKTKD